MGRPIGLLFLILVSGVTAIAMAYGAAAAVGASFAWRNAILLALMLITAIVSLMNGVSLWRRGAGTIRVFTIWYSALALTWLSRHLYREWSWVHFSNLVIEVALATLIGILLARYVRSQLVSPAARSAQA